MFGLGTTEILVILVVALLVLGPQKLPGIAKTLGKTLGEFRRVSSEFQRTLNEEVEQEARKKAPPAPPRDHEEVQGTSGQPDAAPNTVETQPANTPAQPSKDA